MDNETLDLLEEHFDPKSESIAFPTKCPDCNANGESRTLLTQIPHFKDVLIISFVCANCGYRSNDIKAGGEISEKGARTILYLTQQEDLNRDILKSETAGIKIPEIDLEVVPGSLGGRFTTIEGMIQEIHDQLFKFNPFLIGDSAQEDEKQKFTRFLNKLDAIIHQDFQPFHLVLDDPLNNSFISSPYSPDPDPNMVIEEYTRTEKQDEELGLKDMKTENY